VKEIKIIGAGPSGLTAAINLVKQGYDVKVFEKNENCGMRFHGDFQGLENWSSPLDILSELKTMNIAIDFWHKPVVESEFFDFRRNKRTVKFEKPGLYLIKRGALRGSLDLALKEQALKSGVEILFKKRVSEKEGDIIAMGPRRVDGIVRGISFETNEEHVPMIILDDTLAPKSFAYLLTSEGRGCLGTGLTNRYNRANEYFSRTLDTFKKILNLEIVGGHMFTGYFNFFVMNNYERQEKLYVGECAGLQDLLFAFGLRQAMTSGYLAARSITNDESYDNLIKERFYQQLQTSIANRFLFSIMGNRGYSAFLKKGREVKDPVRRMYKQYNTSFAKKIILPLANLVLKR